MVRAATPHDSNAITTIYNYYILNTVVTFEETPVTASEMQQRVADAQNRYAWLVWEDDGQVTGYAYATSWKVRAAYRYAVEISVYLDPAHTGKGIGRLLYEALIEQLHKLKIHAIIGGIALPNDASIKLHEALGFKKIAQFREVGFKFGKWVDVGYWELLVEQ